MEESFKMFDNNTRFGGCFRYLSFPSLNTQTKKMTILFKLSCWSLVFFDGFLFAFTTSANKEMFLCYAKLVMCNCMLMKEDAN